MKILFSVPGVGADAVRAGEVVRRFIEGSIAKHKATGIAFLLQGVTLKQSEFCVEVDVRPGDDPEELRRTVLEILRGAVVGLHLSVEDEGQLL
jgi:hypothetical protein